MTTLNLGVVAHVDAGKTTLTERLLFETGVISSVGRVDHGDTTTDSDALERRRGITIRSAVVTFRIGDVKVNLIDTPGHSDFVAEVERALSVLDCAVLVVSAVEGVQAQTRVLIRILERLQIPFLVFANKVDRTGASYDGTVRALRSTVAGDAVSLTAPRDEGSKDVTVVARRGPVLTEELVLRLADYDDELLRRYVAGTPVSSTLADEALARLTAAGHLHPVYFGSAMTGVGVPHLIDGLVRYLAPGPVADPRAPLHASVFKVERNRTGHRLAYVRMHAGTLTSRDQVDHFHRLPTGTVLSRPGRASAVGTFTEGARTEESSAKAGDIATVAGLPDLKVGDQLGRWDGARGGHYFAPPGLESVVRAVQPTDRARLYDALRELAEQDPLIATRLDGPDQELTVSLYGEVQKEVIAARLATEFGVHAEFLPTQTVYIERPAGVGTGLRVIGTAGNRDLATVGLRVEPGDVDSGITYRREVELGGLLLSFHTAIEETVPLTLTVGLSGWAVTDCVVTLTHSGYWAPVSSAGDFRRITARVLREALAVAGTTVCEPVSEFDVEFPTESLSRVLQRLVAGMAVPSEPTMTADRGQLSGTIPTSAVHAFEQRLPDLTQGQGFLTTRPAGYRPVIGPRPSRRPVP